RVLPSLLQRAFPVQKQRVREEGLELLADEHFIIGGNRKLLKNLVRGPQQLERHRLAQKREARQELLKPFTADVEVRRQEGLDFDKLLADERLRFRLLFRLRNDRRRLRLGA